MVLVSRTSMQTVGLGAAEHNCLRAPHPWRSQRSIMSQSCSCHRGRTTVTDLQRCFLLKSAMSPGVLACQASAAAKSCR